MIVMAALGLFFGIVAGRTAAKASSGFACNLREAMYENIQTYSFSNIDKFSTSGLITRLTTDVTNVQNAYQMTLRMCVRAPIMLIVAMTSSILLSAKISGVFCIAMVILAIGLAIIMFSTFKIFDQMFRRYDDLNASVQENISAIRVVKSFVREDFENSKFYKAAQNIYKLSTKAEGILAFNNPLMSFAMYGCILVISWMGAKMVVGGSLGTGELSSLFTYCMTILGSLMMLSMIFVMLTMSVASVRRITEVLDEKSDLSSPENAVTEIADGSVDFNQVSFMYKHGTGKNVLENIDLHIHSGETIGVIGGTGSAKSSLVNLISRLYDVNSGSVMVGGKDVKCYDLDALRNQVAVVLQKNVLFSGTILENLRWGDENATDEECIHACKLACADDFITAFPDGYNTYIEQGGTNVSGGQRQRLCIARALLKKPKVLILDDSTSAVDTATDARIRKAFREEIPNTTKFIIAQRISSVQEADRIIVMDDGHVSGFDTHENLLKTNEIYQEIYEGQTKGGGDFDEKGGN
jgi:ATP-binding cassette subfamily B protein